MKVRTSQHLNNVAQLKNRGIHLDSFPNHCVDFFKKRELIRSADVHDAIEIRMLRELNSISVSKKFGSHEC